MMEWIRTANIKKYDVISAFKNMNEIDWTKSNFNISKGDIVYIYVGEPYSKIMYKTFCTDDDVKKENAINDIVYWSNQNEFDQERKKIRLRLEQVNSSNKLSLDNLNKKRLVKQRIQGAYKSDKFPDLFEYIASVFETISFDEDYEIINKIYSNTSLNETEKELLSKVRVGQGIYREKLILKYSGKCALCGLKHKPLLIASHVKEWKNSTNRERLDENNGLLLCTMHDSLFDKHLISFDDNGKILISSLLDDEDLSLLNINKNTSIEINQEMKHYLKYHRESFENNK